jgi:hypothetical protein
LLLMPDCYFRFDYFLSIIDIFDVDAIISLLFRYLAFQADGFSLRFSIFSLIIFISTPMIFRHYFQLQPAIFAISPFSARYFRHWFHIFIFITPFQLSASADYFSFLRHIKPQPISSSSRHFLASPPSPHYFSFSLGCRLLFLSDDIFIALMFISWYWLSWR